MLFALLVLLAPAAIFCLPTEVSNQDAFYHLDSLLKDYDTRIRPGGNEPLKVEVSAYILGISEIDRENRDITISMYLRHYWADERLPVKRELSMSSIKPFWHPDTFFVNEKRVNLPARESENFIRIQPGGEILWSQLITKKISCSKNSTGNGNTFPCSMSLESYGYKLEEIVYSFKEGENTLLSGANIEVPGVEIVGVQGKVEELHLESGNYSTMNIIMELKDTGVWH